VQKVAFHPNGHELVTASEDGAAVIWDTKTGKPLYRVLRHRAPVQDVVYTEDGRFILTSSSDRTVRLWDAASGFPVTPPFLNPWSIGFGTVDPSAKEILCMTSGGGLAWIWRIEDCDYDSDLIVDYGRLLSGNQLSAETSTEEIYEWWRSGRSGSSEDFSVSQSDIVDWHRGQAFDALMSIMRFRGQFRWEDFDRLVKAEAFHVSRMEALGTPRNLSESNYSQRVRDKIRKEREALDTK
jgi:WD40 repeat protein